MDFIKEIFDKYPRETIIINNDFSKGHISLKTAFTMQGNPNDNANKIAKELKKNDWIEKVEIVGPYVNVWLYDDSYLTYLKLMEQYENNNKTVIPKKIKGKPEKQKILIEHTSTNPNKPIHMGHLRNAILGDALAKLYKELGYNVTTMSYINDMGLQVAQLLWDYINNPVNEKDIDKFDFYLGERYVEIAKKMDDEKIKTQVATVLKDLEHGKNQTAKKGREMSEKCIKRHHQSLDNFKIYHDYDIFESDIVHHLFDEGMKKIKQSADIYFAEDGEHAGCYVAKLEGKEFNNLLTDEKVLIRSNGTLTYTGKDIIFHLWKLGLLKTKLPIKKWFKQKNGTVLKYSKDNGKLNFEFADKIINVIGSEQDMPQQSVKYILSKVTKDNTIDERYHHLSYGPVKLEHGEKLSGRKGTWKGFTADSILEQGIEKAKEKLKGKKLNIKKTSRAMAVSALRFVMLKYSPQKNIHFSWDKALQFDGDSAPYIQYAYVRCKSVLEKVKKLKNKKNKMPKEYKFDDNEIALLNMIIEYDNVLNKACKDLKMNEIINYMLNLVPAYNKFYDNCRIIDEGKLNPTRVRIVETTVKTLERAMDICGIEKLDKM